MYAKPSNLVARYTEKEIAEVLGAPNKPVDLSNERLIVVCERAKARADRYIRQACELPLPSVPDELVEATEVIARYFLHKDDTKEGGDNGKSRQRLDYEDAIDWLKQVASGELDLFNDKPDPNIPDSPHAVKATSRIAVVSSPVVFDDELLGKMG